jgi:hypothetical protein
MSALPLVTALDAPADRLGRRLRDLRISVTDRCNFRCRYCMPKEVFGSAFRFLPRAEILSYEEIGRVARAAWEVGARKMRLTGGEPLLRRDLPELVAMLAALPGVEVALTTNGALLAERAGHQDEGLQAVGGTHPSERVEPGIAGQAVVGEHHVIGVSGVEPLEVCARLRDVGGAIQARSGERRQRQLGVRRGVLEQKYPQPRHAFSRAPPAAARSPASRTTPGHAPRAGTSRTRPASPPRR